MRAQQAAPLWVSTLTPPLLGAGGNHAPHPNLVFIIGARRKDLLLCEAELTAAGVDARAATEDGSHGTQGRVTDVLEPLLMERSGAAGDGLLLRADPDDAGGRRAVSKTRGPCQLSVEVAMPCGIGVCMGCVWT